MENYKKLEKQIEELEVILEEKDKNWDWSADLPYGEYCNYMQPERKKIAELDRKLRLIRPYELSELSNFGDIIMLNDFIEACKAGLFFNSDGFGKYVKDDMETDIEIYPSDIKHNSIRKEFDTIIWFNK